MAVQIDRANVLESQIKDQIGDMQRRNLWLKNANKALEALRKNRPSDPSSTAEYGSFVWDSRFEEAPGVSSRETVLYFMASQGIDISNTLRADQNNFDTAINNLKTKIDTVNSQSQMDMVRLQGLMDKRNQAFDMLTNNLSKFSKSMDSVIGNMR